MVEVLVVVLDRGCGEVLHSNRMLKLLQLMNVEGQCPHWQRIGYWTVEEWSTWREA